MTTVTDCKFKFNYKDNRYPYEVSAPMEFEIELTEPPEALRPKLRSAYHHTGCYMEQVRWASTRQLSSNMPVKLIVFIYGDVNFLYSASLVSLFGDVVGMTLLSDGEDFIQACRERWREDRSRTVAPTSTTVIVERMLEDLTNIELGQRVLDQIVADATS